LPAAELQRRRPRRGLGRHVRQLRLLHRLLQHRQVRQVRRRRRDTTLAYKSAAPRTSTAAAEQLQLLTWHPATGGAAAEAFPLPLFPLRLPMPGFCSTHPMISNTLITARAKQSSSRVKGAAQKTKRAAATMAMPTAAGRR